MTASVAEGRLGDLAHRVARERVEVADLARALVRGQQPRDVVGELALARPLVALDDDPGDDPLAEVVVGLAGHRRLGDAGVLDQRVLDLARADLVAAALDQVGRAAARRSGCSRPPTRVATSPVANQPSRIASSVASGRFRYSRKRFGPRTWISPTVSSSAHVQLVAVVVHEPHLDPGERNADRPRPAVAVGADRRVHQRLAHPVALDELQARGLPRSARDRRPAARRSRRPAAARRRPRAPAPATPRDPPRAGGTSSARRTASSRGPDSAAAAASRREPAEMPRAAAAPQRPEHAEDQPVHVEQRQPVRDDVVAGPLPRVRQRVEVRGERPPRQHDALRRPGRPGRVDDDRGRLVVRLVGPGHSLTAARIARRRARARARCRTGCARARARPTWG